MPIVATPRDEVNNGVRRDAYRVRRADTYIEPLRRGRWLLPDHRAGSRPTRSSFWGPRSTLTV